MPNILIIEDDPAQRSALEEFLTDYLGKKGNVFAAEDLETARTVFRDRKIQLIVTDLMLPDGTGIEFVKEIKDSKIPVLLLTGQPSIETAIEAIRAGASDYLIKPVDLSHLQVKITSLLENSELKEENRILKARLQDRFSAKNIVGNAQIMKPILDRIRQVAPTDVTVLLEGESGTGKELFANLLHENSPRADKPFIKVNCGALTKTILESELFGAVKGAYTGSDRDRAGYFESANGGTIFLDEIGEMDLESQVRLLRVIEEREVVRVGSSKPAKVDVRVIAATNRSLQKEVEAGKFREDLYYRLAVIRIELPALRMRKEDIPILFNHFVTGFNEKYRKSVNALSPELNHFFQQYDWPGNIRQLRNVLEGMVVLAQDNSLTLADLPDELAHPTRRTADKKLMDSVLPGIAMDDYEKAIILKNLSYTGGNREKAAKLLGLSERTLYRKIKDYGMEND
ncbi:MAG TPA: sigma-54 dependent transcriptional regulator [Leptospiraceae bacterium]|nr:sigma-54 dependent transcriptional regulator [Leptospirales bacterium]HMX57220.1 sigma-54 dependent transcriptional regulator [Leptospiraceae bacterium]HNE24487.1 sigma-54 dependent transcriptional regulator [Leptospiraceae bacterium]HNJ03215.1 sigma-54 dependent transcriptional regulator [Leptospiraceae bacterium]HNK99948.1 sigma-54 dependent transcriptional regulator [Leptospiraceae bacterium]